jgi:hypothetical protein
MCQAGIANGVHYGYMLSQTEPGADKTLLLTAAGRVARVSADPTAFALLLEHTNSVEQLRDLWTEMSETGAPPSIRIQGRA